jgi:hypothetical protein
MRSGVAGPGPHSNFGAVVRRQLFVLDTAPEDLVLCYLPRVKFFLPS